MEDAIFDRLREACSAVLAEEPVLFAYLFGSQATGQTHPRSDVDVAVYLDPSGPVEDALDASLRLANKLATTSGVGNLEVLVLNAAPLRLRGRVVQHSRILYSRDEPHRVRYESRTLREFFDFEIHARELDRQFFRDVAEGRR